MKQYLRFLVPLVIVVLIGGVYFLKNSSSEAADDGEFRLVETGEMPIEAMKAKGLPIVLDYGSDDCPPCVAMKPDLKAVNEEMQGKAFVKFVDVWKYEGAEGDLPVAVLPTQFFITADGKPYVPSEAVSAQIEFLAYSNRETGEHTYTAHEGMLSKAELELILEDMGVAR